MTTIKCSICGEEFEAPTGMLGNWMAKNPDKAKCPNCYGKKSNSAPAGKAVSSNGYKKTSTAPAGKVAKQDVSAEMFRRAYDELLAEFADVKEDVAPYLGGWVSTIVINRSK